MRSEVPAEKRRGWGAYYAALVWEYDREKGVGKYGFTAKE